MAFPKNSRFSQQIVDLSEIAFDFHPAPRILILNPFWAPRRPFLTNFGENGRRGGPKKNLEPESYMPYTQCFASLNIGSFLKCWDQIAMGRVLDLVWYDLSVTRGSEYPV